MRLPNLLLKLNIFFVTVVAVLALGSAKAHAQYQTYIDTLPTAIPSGAVDAELKARLESEIDLYMDGVEANGNKPYAPLMINAGLDNNGYVYFFTPGETIYALSTAYPYLSTGLQGRVKTFMTAQLSSYPLHSSLGYTANQNGDIVSNFSGFPRREYYPATSQTYNLWPPVSNVDVSVLYTIWAYSYYTSDWAYVTANYTAIKNIYTSFAGGNSLTSYPQMAGVIGFARIAQHQNQTADYNTAVTFANARFASAENLTQFVTTAKTSFPRAAQRYTTELFRIGDDNPITTHFNRDLGRFIKDKAAAGAASYSAQIQTEVPLWWMTTGFVSHGERAFSTPEIAWTNYMLRAYALGDNTATLKAQLDLPIYKGDLYYTQKLVAAIESAANTNQAPSSTISSPVGNQSILVGQSLSFAGSGSDPEGCSAGNMTYLWNFGTGSGIANSTSQNPGSKTFSNTGTFTVSFTVTDCDGNTDLTPATMTVTVSAGATDKIVNGNFESGTPPPFTGWSGSGAGNVSTAIKHGGSYAAKVTSGLIETSSTIAVQSSKTYSLVFWMRCDSFAVPAWGGIVVRILDASFNPVASTNLAQMRDRCLGANQAQWFKQALNYAPTSNGNVRIDFGIWGPGTGTVYFDDLQFLEKTTNAAPISSPQGSGTTGGTSTTFTFTANADDPDGAINFYKWEFGDGTISNDINPSHNYLAGGQYTPMLTIWDDSNDSSITAGSTITIADTVAPVIAITSPSSNVNHSVLQATATTTIGGTIALGSGGSSISSITWNNINTDEAGTITVPSPLSNGWSKTGVGLKYGNNEILISTVDNNGNVATDRIFIYRALSVPDIKNYSVSATNVYKYQKTEISFDVDTVADNYFFAYDANPPEGIVAEQGVTVKAIIGTPSGQTLNQPAFYTKLTTQNGSGSSMYFTEQATGKWYVRYAPQETGNHTIWLQATDKTGTDTQLVVTITVTNDPAPTANKGFVKVSAADPRYFEYSNGDLYWPVGPVDDDTYATNPSDGANIIRPWMGGDGVYSSNWARWMSSAENLGNEGFQSTVSYREVYPKSELAYTLYKGGGERYWMGSWLDSKFSPRFTAGKTYQVSLRFKAVNVVGPNSYSGFVIKIHDDFPASYPQSAVNLRNEPSLIGVVKGTSDWHTLVTRFTTDSAQNGGTLPIAGQYINIYLDDVTTGEVYIDQFSVKEVINPGGAESYGGELIRNSKADLHEYAESRPAAYYDWQVEQGMQHNVYHKYVIQDKNDWIPNHLGPQGQFSSFGDGYYQPDGTKTRWLQNQWWRYLSARYGYATSVHSWELNNEGDPGSPAHYASTQALAAFMNANSAHPHLSSTSFWASWQPNFWKNVSGNYPDVGYADIHEYTDNSDIPSGQVSALERDLAGLHLYLADKVKASMPIGKPVLRAESGLAHGTNFTALESFLTSSGGNGLFYHNLLWVQLDSTAVFDMNYWWAEHLDKINRSAVAVPFARFVNQLDVNKGGYVDIAATLSDTNNFRIVGQKNNTKRKAHFWIQNKNNTWYTNSIGSNPNSAGDVTVTIAMTPNEQYTITRWNTYTGAVASTSTQSANGAGNLTLTIQNLTTDSAYLIQSTTALPTATPTPILTPTNTPAPSATPTGVPAPSATPTGAPAPTATNTPVPTATNTPGPTATPTITPTPGGTTINEAEGWLQFNKDAQNSGHSNYQVNPNYRLNWVWMDRNRVASNGTSGAARFPGHVNPTPNGPNPQINETIVDDEYVEPNIPVGYEFPDVLATSVQPVVAGAQLFVGSMKGDFFAINAVNGTTNWVHTESTMPIMATAAYDVLSNTIVYGSLDGKLYGLNPITGSKLWEYQTGAGISAHLKIYNGVVYVGSRDGKFYAINANNGTVKSGWNNQPYSTRVAGDTDNLLGLAPIISPAVLSTDGSKVFFAAENMYMYALNTSNGSEAWAPKKMVGQSTTFSVPFLLTDAQGNDKVLIPVVSSLLGAEGHTTLIEQDITNGSTFGYGGTTVRTATEGPFTYNPGITPGAANAETTRATLLAAEMTALRALLAANPNQQVINAFAASDGSYPFSAKIPLGRVTGNNFAPFPGVKAMVGGTLKTIMYWRSSFASLLADTYAFGTRFCPDISVIDPGTGERNYIVPSGGQLNQCPELDNGFALTSGGNRVYMQNSFRGVRTFLPTGGDYTYVTHSQATFDGGVFRGYPTQIIYYGNDTIPSKQPSLSFASAQGHSAVIIARVNGKNYLYIVDPDSGAPVSSIVNEADL